MNRFHQINFKFLRHPGTSHCALLCAFLFSLNTLTCFAAENQPEKQVPSAQEIEIEMEPSISWPVDLEALSKNNSANEFFWTNIGDEKLLVLKYFAKGPKFRGNVVLLPAEGENADHPRITQPLAIQLSRLGWQVFVPNLPIEDYPVKLTDEASNLQPENEEITDESQQNLSSQQDPEQKNNNQSPDSDKPKVPEIISFFKNIESYQQFINQALQQIVEQVQPKSESFILIGDKNSAYWILESAKQLPEIQQVVLLEPKLPKMVTPDLKSSFEGQFLPIHTFMQSDIKSTTFTRAFDRQLWQSNYQRFNRGLISNKQIEIEDPSIAKAITGWVESIKKSSQN